jgi:hypothetical protein
MKKKSPRGIPDFSNKRLKSGPLSKTAPQKQSSPVAPQRVNIKPQATSSKSGQRGQ